MSETGIFLSHTLSSRPVGHVILCIKLLTKDLLLYSETFDNELSIKTFDRPPDYADHLVRTYHNQTSFLPA